MVSRKVTRACDVRLSDALQRLIRSLERGSPQSRWGKVESLLFRKAHGTVRRKAVGNTGDAVRWPPILLCPWMRVRSRRSQDHGRPAAAVYSLWPDHSPHEDDVERVQET